MRHENGTWGEVSPSAVGQGELQNKMLRIKLSRDEGVRSKLNMPGHSEDSDLDS